MANRNGIRNENDGARQIWVIGAVALLSVVIVLLVALLMIGIPYLNAKVIEGTGLSSSDLASWQLTSVITMVGMLVGGVFIITAFRVDATAKHTASVETREVVGRALDEERRRLAATISDAESAVAKANRLAKEGELQVGKVIEKAQQDVKAAVGNAESEVRAAKEKAESDVDDAIKGGSSAIDRVVQDAEIRTTAAINSESERFRQATQTALGQSRDEFGSPSAKFERRAVPCGSFWTSVRQASCGRASRRNKSRGFASGWWPG